MVYFPSTDYVNTRTIHIMFWMHLSKYCCFPFDANEFAQTHIAFVSNKTEIDIEHPAGWIYARYKSLLLLLLLCVYLIYVVMVLHVPTC